MGNMVYDMVAVSTLPLLLLLSSSSSATNDNNRCHWMLRGILQVVTMIMTIVVLVLLRIVVFFIRMKCTAPVYCIRMTDQNSMDAGRKVSVMDPVRNLHTMVPYGEVEYGTREHFA